MRRLTSMPKRGAKSSGQALAGLFQDVTASQPNVTTMAGLCVCINGVTVGPLT